MDRVALNERGQLTHVTNANKTENYYCRWCRARMELRYLYGDWYFALVPGAAHDHKKCATHHSRILDAWLTSKAELESGLLTKSTKNRDGPNGDKKRWDDAPLQSKYSSSDYTLVPVRYLSDFWKGGIYEWPADTRLNGYWLTDIFVSKKNAFVLMHNNYPLGFRIVDVRFHRCLNNNVLRFALYSVTDEGKCLLYFDLYVEDEEEYRILKYEVDRDKGARYFLAGKWEVGDCSALGEKSDWRIVGAQKTTFSSDHQIYRCGRR